VKDYLGIICIVLGITACGLGYMSYENVTLHSKATPPGNVTDIKSCLVWLKQPCFIYKITDGGTVYYQMIGPDGASASSGQTAYSFDGHGKLLGWTTDAADSPTVHFSPIAKKKTISEAELEKQFP